MINILRKNQQWLMILITVLVIISFVWFYNGVRTDRAVRPDDIGKIYGRTVRFGELRRASGKFQLARELGLFDMLRTLGPMSQVRSMEEAVEEFMWNLLVLRHEADQLEIRATDDEIFAKLKALPTFQTNGAFDKQKFEQYTSMALTPKGFTAKDLEELLADAVRLDKIKALVGTTAHVSEAAVREQFQQAYQKVNASVVRLSLAEFEKTIEPSAEAISKYYETNKEQLKSEEKRKVKYAAFALSEEQKKLTGKERLDALQQLADRAGNFSAALAGKEGGFDDLAKKFEAPVKETGLFTMSAPDPEVAKIPGFIAACTRLTEAQPDSDIVQSESGFFMLHLAQIEPPNPLTLQEATPQIVETIKKQLGREAMDLKVLEARKKVNEALQAGKTFAEAAAAAGLAPVNLPPFSQAEPPKDMPDARPILSTALEMAPGQLSDPIPTMDGGTALVYLVGREPLDEARFTAEGPRVTEFLRAQEQMAVFTEWFRLQREAARIQNKSLPG